MFYPSLFIILLITMLKSTDLIGNDMNKCLIQLRDEKAVSIKYNLRDSAQPSAIENSLISDKLQNYEPALDSARPIGRGQSGAKTMLLKSKRSKKTEESISVVVKVDGPRQSADAEVLAYELSEILDLGLVSPTIKRNINGNIVSIQHHVSGDNLDNFYAYAREDYSYRRLIPEVENKRNKAKIFNFIIGDVLDGSKSEHHLIEALDTGARYNIIDKGDAFSHYTDFSLDLQRQIANFFEMPQGEEFRQLLIEKSPIINEQVKKKYGPSSTQFIAFENRLRQIINLKKLKDLPEPESMATSITNSILSRINNSQELTPALITEIRKDIDNWFRADRAPEKNSELHKILQQKIQELKPKK